MTLADRELDAMDRIVNALNALEKDQRERVLTYLIARYGGQSKSGTGAFA